MAIPQAVYATLVQRRTFMLEACLALASMLCGMVLMFPPVRQFLLSSILGFMPPSLLGAVFLAHGMASTVVLVRRDMASCLKAARASMRLWSYPAICFALVPPAHFAALVTGISVVMATSAAWVALRLDLKLSK